MNAVFPNKAIIPARGAYFLARALMDAHNVSNAIDIIMNHTTNGPVCSYGGSYNIADENNIINIEVSNFDVSVEYYGDEIEYGYHFNMFERLNISQQTDVSSIKRSKRLNEILNHMNKL